ncbi:hypothetical protein F5Y17DRAFT_453859 [Xylariaceae sp. FL0594]|nr:hypothetical protein F5Y17DRAFT_453859 [Xylariaceae sp. FL0594]
MPISSLSVSEVFVIGTTIRSVSWSDVDCKASLVMASAIGTSEKARSSTFPSSCVGTSGSEIRSRPCSCIIPAMAAPP